MSLQLLHTPLTWKDLSLHAKTEKKIRELNDLIQQQEKGSHLFYGASGTGKTLTAALLGKQLGREVAVVNLSLMVSKYIGETEKNINPLFKEAEKRGQILFFDEADALFGKRGEVRDANDKYANAEVSYLLQRIEAHPGIVILSTNLKTVQAKKISRRFYTATKFRNSKK